MSRDTELAQNQTVSRPVRLIKRALFLMPTISTAMLRIVQLGILLVLSNLATGPEGHLLVAGFGLLSSFAMMTDSGAANFILSTPLERIYRGVYRKSVGFHFLLSGLGAIAAIAFIGIPAGGVIPDSVLLLLVAFALTQIFDSTSRVVRAPLLVARRDTAYAVPDLVLLVLKLPIILLAVIWSDLSVLLWLPLPSIVVTVVVFIAVRRALQPSRAIDSRLIFKILEFGVTGALSALFSQAPLLIAAAFLPLDQLAMLTIIYRVVQALDLVPGTLSLQMIPRVRDHRFGAATYWAAFAAGGAVVALCVVLARPLIEYVFGTHLESFLVFALVAASFAPKSGNYALVAFLMGTGQIRLRFVLTAVACVLAVVLSLVGVQSAGVVGLAIVTVAIELIFAGSGLLALRLRAIKPPTATS